MQIFILMADIMKDAIITLNTLKILGIGLWDWVIIFLITGIMVAAFVPNLKSRW